MTHGLALPVLAGVLIAVMPAADAYAARADHTGSKPALRSSSGMVRALDRVASANRAALREPVSARFINAAQVQPWTDGGVYRLYTAPEQVSDIALQAGESLISVAAGDTARWIIGDTSSGSGEGRRVHVLVKPSAPGLKTNLVIATDRRTYLVALLSTAKTSMPVLSWTYPADDLLALRASAGPSAAAIPIALGPLDRLNFDYSISGDRTAWRPLRAFDDGHQVFIEFPASMSSDEAPPLFVIGKDGKVELINYRLRGRYYVVDRLFALAELRIGSKRHDVVRIERSASTRRRRP